jgi:hypothetical protein
MITLLKFDFMCYSVYMLPDLALPPIWQHHWSRANKSKLLQHPHENPGPLLRFLQQCQGTHLATKLLMSSRNNSRITIDVKHRGENYKNIPFFLAQICLLAPGVLWYFFPLWEEKQWRNGEMRFWWGSRLVLYRLRTLTHLSDTG